MLLDCGESMAETPGGKAINCNTGLGTSAAVTGAFGLAAFELALEAPLLGTGLLVVLTALAARFFALVASVEVYSTPPLAAGDGGSASASV